MAKYGMGGRATRSASQARRPRHTVNHVSTGVYNVTATLSQCANVTTARR